MSGLSSKKPAVVGRVWHYLTFFQRVRQRLLSLEKTGVELRQKISQVEQDHAAAVAWARKTYPEIVAAIESRVAESQLNRAIQDIYSVVHRENGKLSERLGRVEQGGGRGGTGRRSTRPANSTTQVVLIPSISNWSAVSVGRKKKCSVASVTTCRWFRVRNRSANAGSWLWAWRVVGG